MPSKTSWDLRWPDRPCEEARNFNPAFCGEMLFRTVSEYFKLRRMPFSFPVVDRGQRASLVADIGAGTGYFSVRIAKRIPEGKIFAADIEPDMVRYLGERARREHLNNLLPVQASSDAANLPEPVDVALVVDTFHHIGNRTQYFAKLKSSLRPAGRLVIVDFKADSPNGPPVRHRVSP
jgi:SAM-dependent methyltransferase